MPSEPFIAEIYIGGMNFAPRGYALCQGQLLSHCTKHRIVFSTGHHFRWERANNICFTRSAWRVPVGMGAGAGFVKL